jgi:hypothetical protein
LEKNEVPELVFEGGVFEPGTFPTTTGEWEVLPVRVDVVPYIAYFDYEFPFDLSDDGTVGFWSAVSSVSGLWTALGNAL